MTELPTSMGSIKVTLDGSLQDFNSDGAFCEQLLLTTSGEGSPQEVEILGMNLLLDQSDHDCFRMNDDDDDDSDLDSTGELVPTNLRTVLDSLEPNIVVLRGTPKKSNNTNCKQRRNRVQGPCSEVDSLVLARERLPHAARDTARDLKLSIDRRVNEGKGLRGEVDSLILHHGRLARCRHKREPPSTDAVISWTRNPQKASRIQYCILPLNDLKQSEIPDPLSVSPTDPQISSEVDDSIHTVNTIDSIILAQRRLASHPRWAQRASHARAPPALRSRTNSMPKGTSGLNRPPKGDLGLGSGLQKVSSGACAA